MIHSFLLNLAMMTRKVSKRTIGKVRGAVKIAPIILTLYFDTR